MVPELLKMFEELCSEIPNLLVELPSELVAKRKCLARWIHLSRLPDLLSTPAKFSEDKMASEMPSVFRVLCDTSFMLIAAGFREFLCMVDIFFIPPHSVDL